jgi:2,3-bisphosphoglycerate-independent phosphoglycerate mutase
MKFLLLVADGMGDIGKPTPLSAADKPAMDKLAGMGRCGLLDIGYGKNINSDRGFLSILGAYSDEGYPGRGYLEALGIGMRPGPDDVCIRGNFASLDKDGNILHRRAGRDETGLLGFAEKLDGMEIDGIKFLVKKSAGHRVVILMQGEGLSTHVEPNDPLKTGVPLPEVKPRGDEGKLTASVLNKFTRRVHDMLKDEPVNRMRKLPANMILIRNTGKQVFTRTFQERYGMKSCCIAGVPIAKGVARLLDMDVIPVMGATGMPDTDLEAMGKAAVDAFKEYDFVFLHINGTDILSHDARRKEKREFIEKIDAELGRMLDATGLKGFVYIVTCDHRTVSLAEFKGYRHLPDPVPVLVAGDTISKNGVNQFDEAKCEAGFSVEGNGLLPYVLKAAGVRQ